MKRGKSHFCFLYPANKKLKGKNVWELSRLYHIPFPHLSAPCWKQIRSSMISSFD